eukprot:15242630-Alexandrium_andersonii.AAC.1
MAGRRGLEALGHIPQLLRHLGGGQRKLRAVLVTLLGGKGNEGGATGTTFAATTHIPSQGARISPRTPR